jgi:NADH-quinone oxidoreductase subunit A
MSGGPAGFAPRTLSTHEARCIRVSSVDEYLGSYATMAVLALVGVCVIGGAYLANRLLRPWRPGLAPGKRDSYECGLDPVPGGWAQMHIRYYLYAYLYVLFAVEAIFLFPWAVVYIEAGMAVIAEMGIFVGVLALGLLYAWRKRALTWE